MNFKSTIVGYYQALIWYKVKAPADARAFCQGGDGDEIFYCFTIF
jgi:hypothetical protein